MIPYFQTSFKPFCLPLNSDLRSKIEEIDGDVSYYLNKFNEILERLQMTIQERDTIPVTEIYDDFTRAGEIWTQIYSYTYCLEAIQSVAKTLEDINSVILILMTDSFIRSF